MSDNQKIVLQIKNYVSSHITEPVTASELTKATGYSQYYAARVFKAETGKAPFEYLREQRLIAAAHELRRGQKRVIDIALDYVFDSHEGFTRAFVKAFGIAPKSFSSYKAPKDWQIPYNTINRQSMEDKKMDNTSVIFTQIVERPARKLILKRSQNASEYFEYCEEVGCGTESEPAPWDILCGIKEALYEPVGLWLPPKMRLVSTGIYAHGVEVAQDYDKEIPEGFDVIDLPPCKLLVFQGEPYDDAVFAENVGACMEKIESFNPEVYGYQYAPDIAPKMQLAPMGWRGYIEMRPVTQMKN